MPKNTFSDIDKQIARLAVEKELAINNALTGNNPDDILKAQMYLQSQKPQKGAAKSWLYMPDDHNYRGTGYKSSANRSVTFGQLKSISKLFVVRLIQETRIDQVKNFLKFTADDQVEGYTVCKKKGLFDIESGELSSAEQAEVKKINDFLTNCGNNSKWDDYDDFGEFISKILRDSLTYDQLGFETVRTRGGDIDKFLAVDASLIRILDSTDPRYKDQFQNLMWKGHLPKYCMAWQGQILKNPTTGNDIIYYPWELGFGVRNKQSDVYMNGYGTSELETGVQLITWILWSFNYNGNFFKNGSTPKGFLNIKDGGGDNTTLSDFRDAWRRNIQGPGNEHKIPVFEGIDLEWVDLHSSNKDMEFNQWLEFLMVVFCSLYRIDPTELGFNFSQAHSVFGQDGQKERLEHSKSKGLKPLLMFLQKLINKYIVSEISEGYEFKFTGVDLEDEEAQVKLDKEKSEAGFVSFEAMFEKYMGRPYDEKKDTILNPQFIQNQQVKMNGSPESNSAVEEMEGGSPFDQFGKAIDSEPFTRSLVEYVNGNF